MKIRLLTPVALLVLALMCAWPASARAQEVPDLDSQLVDEAGVVDDRGDVEDALEDLRDDEGIQMFALFVDTTGETTMPAFTDEVVAGNNLGASDALLVVAVEDRTYQLWIGDLLTGEVSQDEQDIILARELEPELIEGDFSGAVVATAHSLGDAASGSITGGDGGGAGTGFFIFLGVVVLIVVLAIAAIWTWSRVRSWRESSRTAEERDRRTGELARRANTLLLEADEGLRDAQQELGFAEAQFSESDVEPFRDALSRARDELRQAFEVRQRLDDGTPEDPPERERMLNEVVSHAEAAMGLIAAERKRLDELRDLERTAPEALQRLAGQLDAVRQRFEPAEQTMARLQRDYPERSLRSISGNLVEARKRTDFTAEAVDAGNAALNAGDRQRAARAARDGEEALAQARSLVDAVDHLEESLRNAQAHLDEEIREASRDLEAARAALRESPQPGESEALAGAEASLANARREAGAAQPDYLVAYQAAVEANTGADAILDRIRDARQRREKHRQRLTSAMRSAEATIDRAEDYIRGRRRGVGRSARTRLAEAERHLDLARELGDGDPERAIAEAQSAQRLAGEAFQIAEDDFDRADRRGNRRGGGMFGPGMIMLGGILLGRMGGGGGGFGGTRWGSPRGGSWGGGFGGAGRSMGGVFGGGRSRGGRW